MKEIRTKYGTWKRILRHKALLVPCLTVFVSLALYLLCRLLVGTPFAAGTLARTLSDYTRHTVTVDGLYYSGKTIRLRGMTIRNPRGFPQGNLLTARSISISPDIAHLVAGKKAFSLIQIDGLKIDLKKNAAGSWNYSELLRRLSSKGRKPPAELLIRRLVLRDVSLALNGYTLDRVGLTVFDLSTKGTSESRLVVSARDPGGAPVTLTAHGRLGPEPSLHLTLEAATLSLSPYRRFLHARSPIGLEAARARLQLTADFRKDVLALRGTGGFDRLVIPAGAKRIPLRGLFEFFLLYDTVHDTARLERARLSVNDILDVRSHGTVRGVRKEGLFSLHLSQERMALKSLLPLLMDGKRGGMTLSGTLSCRNLHLEGNKKSGITGGAGDVSLRGMDMTAKGRMIVRGAGARITLRHGGNSWQAKGRLTASAGGGTALIESLDAPFTARLSDRLKPQRIALPALTLNARGAKVMGGMHYDATAPVPWRVDLSLRDAPLAALNDFLHRAPDRISTGRGSLKIWGTGTSPRHFTAQISAALSSLKGTAGGRHLSLRESAVQTALRRDGNGFTATGAVSIKGGTFDGHPWETSADFALVNENLTIRNCALILNGIRFRVAAAHLRATRGTPGNALSLTGSIAGGEALRGELLLSGLDGRITGRYHSAKPEGRLEGNADITAASVSYHGRPAASLTGRITVAGNRATAAIRGRSLGGTAEAQVHADLHSRNRAYRVALKLRELRLKDAQGLYSMGKGPHLSGGLADAELEGSYAAGTGWRGRISLAGRDISVSGSGSKTLVSGMGIRLSSDLAGTDLSRLEAVITQGRELKLRVHGGMEHLPSPDRKGIISFDMETIPLNSLLDASANALPRSLQEAVGTGTCALSGRTEVNGTSILTRGTLSLDAASLELPSQKLLVADIGGQVPFSFISPWKGMERKSPGLNYSRENYAMLRQSLERTRAAGSRLRIGTIRFGTIETGEMVFSVTADKGTIEAVVAKASLYDGALFGRALFTYGNAFTYSLDLLARDLSLRQFCDSFPAIRGYMTGRVDGVVSLANLTGAAGGMTGYVDLWTKQGKGEKMLVSKDFLQKLAGKKLRGFLFRNDRPYDNGEIVAFLQNGYLTFEKLDISHTNLLGMKDLNVTVVPVQNRISLQHLLESIREAAARGKGGGPGEPPVKTDLKWLE